MAPEWQKLNKPSDTTTTTTTSVVHAKGKFMGVLGLTYPGTASTVTTTSTNGWNSITKPPDLGWNNITRPTDSGWLNITRPQT